MASTNQNSKKQAYNLNAFDESFRIIFRKVMAPVGIRITSNDSAFARQCFNILYWIGFAQLTVTNILSVVTVSEVLDRGALKEENIVFLMLPCMAYLILAQLKTYKMVCQRKIFVNLVSELRGMWPQGFVSEDEHGIIRKMLKELNFLVKGFYWGHCILWVTTIVPLYIDIIRRAFGADVPRTLRYFYWLPFDEYQPIVYEITLTMHAWQTMIALWLSQTGDLIFCAFLSHITTQFDLLCVRIEKLFHVPIDKQLITEYPLGQQNWETLDNEYSSPNNESAMSSEQEKELKKIIVRHNDLIRLSNDVENLFSFALFINFFNSSITICFCGFCCLMIEEWNEFMYKTFLITTLCQTWLISWYGQKLLECSANVADALYNSGWYTASNGIKKSILIMIHRSQKRVCITTYGFSVISLSSFTAIIKTAWSYFTLLLNTYNK